MRENTNRSDYEVIESLSHCQIYGGAAPNEHNIHKAADKDYTTHNGV